MTFNYENKKLSQGYSYVIGCDEVGRGCLAGPVVAAAVILPGKSKIENYKVIMSCGIRDSKLLTAKKRQELAEIIKGRCVAWSIGEVSHESIDEINIHNATLLAMRKAIELLLCHCEAVAPTEASFSSGVIPSASEESFIEGNSTVKGSLHSSDALLGRDDTKKVLIVIDGKFIIPDFHLDQEAVVDGDNKILSIAAASIIAKVYRDELMRKIHRQYPVYNFAQHKGYGTLFHRTMILQNGLSPIHRKSFCQHLA